MDITSLLDVVIDNKEFIIFATIRLNSIDEVSGWSPLNNLLFLSINYVFSNLLSDYHQNFYHLF